VRIARFTTGQDPRYAIVEDDSTLSVVSGDPLFQAVQKTGESISPDDEALRLLAPVIPRSKVVAVGKNYADHVAEMGGGDAPKEPLLFLKPNTSVIGPDDPIRLPRQSHEVHFEGELAIVIGRLCKDVPLERVNDVILGYTVANDVTARDLQRSDGQWARAKGFDTFCPLGPYLVTGLSLDEAADLHLTTRVNGELKQDARTSQLIHDIPAIVQYATAAFTLLPGDVILTGTPSGVGPIVAGDVVEVEIEHLGALRNPVAPGD
jgi:2-keto-4-pentenoate hydratase/2-oxohepta-3-ene-1,7-dioic acid hydratase in catechol pathway